MNRISTCLLAAALATLSITAASATASEIESRENPQESPGAVSRNNSPTADSEGPAASPFSIHYFGIYYGPSLQKGTERPALDTRNFLTLNASVSPDTFLGITTGWSWQGIPTGVARPRDPFLKLARNNIVHSGAFSWYGDFRVHLPITAESRQKDLWVGMQSFHYLGWEPGDGGAGLAISARYNLFGGEGRGDQWELYGAPNVYWNVSPRLAFNLMLEWGAGRPVGEDPRLLLSNGLDLDPGFSWKVSDGLLLSPYLSLPLDRTSQELSEGAFAGMTLSWQLL